MGSLGLSPSGVVGSGFGLGLRRFSVGIGVPGSGVHDLRPEAPKVFRFSGVSPSGVVGSGFGLGLRRFSVGIGVPGSGVHDLRPEAPKVFRFSGVCFFSLWDFGFRV